MSKAEINALKEKIEKLEKELHDSLQREADKDCLLRHSPDILYRTDLEGIVTYISPAVENLCGYTVEEAIGMNMAKEVYLYPEVRKTFLEELQKKGKINNFVNQLKHKDGSVWWGSANAHLYFDDDGDLAGVEGVVRDVTKLKNAEDERDSLNATLEKKVNQRTEELERLNEHLITLEERARKHFAYALHDTIAQTVVMTKIRVQQMQNRELSQSPDELNLILKHLEQAIHDIRSLVFELSPPAPNDLEVGDAIDYIIDELNLLHHTNFKFQNNIEGIFQLKETKKIGLCRAVNELLINVIKHSGTKEAEVEIWLNKKSIFINVRDSGVGFDFKTINKREILGFGLYSLFERIKNMGGRFELDSSSGQGTNALIIAPIDG